MLELAGVGAAAAAAQPTSEMGAFMDVLLRRELVRDPLAEVESEQRREEKRREEKRMIQNRSSHDTARRGRVR